MENSQKQVRPNHSKLSILFSALGIFMMLASTIIILYLYNKQINLTKRNLVLANSIQKLNTQLNFRVINQSKIINHLLLANKISVSWKNLGYTDEEGKDFMYRYNLMINDKTLSSQLNKVDYFFVNPGFIPQHKISVDSLHQFNKSFSASGTSDTVYVYLYYKKIKKIDTVLYLMSDKVDSLQEIMRQKKRH